ncbi:MAG: hypothetical protein ABSC65_29895 [Acidobacteriaceae bacterium]
MSRHVTRSRLFIVLVIGAVALAKVFAQAPAVQSSPFPLHHGINLSNWFAFHGPGAFNTNRDLAPITDVKKFDYVRLLVNPEYPADPHHPSPSEVLLLPLTAQNGLNKNADHLDTEIKQIIDSGLKVVIALDPSDEYRCQLNDRTMWDRTK